MKGLTNVYYVIDQNDTIWLESDNLLKLLNDFNDLLDLCQDIGDVNRINYFNARINCYYPDKGKVIEFKAFKD